MLSESTLDILPVARPQGIGPAKMVLQSTGMNKIEAEMQIGDAVRNPFKTTNQPFQPPWLSGRQCNLDAAQFKVPSEEGEHPYWDMVFDHTFASLTEPIKRKSWFGDNGIHCGGDYGRAWLACLLKCPFEPLPVLATVGEGSICLHLGQSTRTSRWARTASSDEATRYGSTSISTRRVRAPGASLVWSVEKTRWPVSDA